MQRTHGAVALTQGMAPLDPTSRALDALGNRYRRELLSAVEKHASESLFALEVADRIRPRTRTRRSLELALVHVHLPKLESYAFIRWDPETGLIRAGPQWDTVEALMEAIGCAHPIEPPD